MTLPKIHQSLERSVIISSLSHSKLDLTLCGEDSDLRSPSTLMYLFSRTVARRRAKITICYSQTINY